MIKPEQKSEIENCIPVLKSGGVILYPTDTIWGLGCDATNENAVEKIFELKKRPESKAMIVLLDSEKKLGKYIRHVPDAAWDLIEYSERPLTIIYPGAVNLAKNLVGSDGTIAIRIPKHDFCRELISRFGKPIVSTSANFSGEQFPASFAEINPGLKQQCDYVVNLPSEKSKKGKPSIIMSLGVKGEIRILRK